MPSSRVRKNLASFNPFESIISDKANRTFIADHAASLNLCDHPEISTLHGVTVGKRQNVDPEVRPIFSLSKTTVNTDILGVPTEQYQDHPEYVPWAEKTNESLVWRGSNTGAWYSTSTTWRQSHRTRLVMSSSRDADGEVDLLPAPKSKVPGSLEDALLSTSRSWLNAKYLDVAFTGDPIRE